MAHTNNQLNGLTDIEVKERTQRGQSNNYEANVAKTNREIIQENLLTLFNFLNVLIGIFLALVGAFSNMAYLAIIVVNIVIGISQEIHARNLVSKLTIVNKAKTKVIRNAQIQEIDATELVLDDIVLVSAGEQIPADLTILKGKAEANESLLTGESDLVEKEEGGQLLSGSYLSSGQCYGRVVHVGADNYATKIASQAKVHKPIQSELVASIRKVSKFTSYIIIPLGIILFVEGIFIRSSDTKTAVVASAAALLGMLPKGLVLLISISLSTAVIKLAKKRILVQDMYAVETLAHVDTLCLDKTGTITEGKMKVQKVGLLSSEYETKFPEIIGSYLAHSTDNNITIQAIRDYFEESDRYKASEIIAFSSERKWGAMYLENVGTVLLGAPDRLAQESELPVDVQHAQEKGYRVLMVGLTEEKVTEESNLTNITQLALLEIDDPIRAKANETLAYLKAEGVDLKVISGDNPVTVSNIARRAGLAGYDHYIDLSSLTDENEVRAAVAQYTVFGRVSPQQKRIIVQELKDKEHVVAMTGDGVNDVLALREADCSIAMAEGDSATKQIANLVLLDSDFTSLPDVLFEGRRVVNNVTKVSGIFFIKTIYSLILSIICAITAIAFPFVPIQITLLDLAIEGYPSFFLSFEENKKKVRGKFLPTVLKSALPNALLVVLNIIAVYIYSRMNSLGNLETTTLMYYLLISISLMAVVKACYPFNPLRIFLSVTTIVGIFATAYLFRSILYIGTLTANTLLPFIVLLVITMILRRMIFKITKV